MLIESRGGNLVQVLAQLLLSPGYDAIGALYHVQSVFGHALFIYRKKAKYWNSYVWANSADQDQTAPIGEVWYGSTLFSILLAVKTKLHVSIFRTVTV